MKYPSNKAQAFAAWHEFVGVLSGQLMAKMPESAGSAGKVLLLSRALTLYFDDIMETVDSIKQDLKTANDIACDSPWYMVEKLQRKIAYLEMVTDAVTKRVKDLDLWYAPYFDRLSKDSGEQQASTALQDEWKDLLEYLTGNTYRDVKEYIDLQTPKETPVGTPSDQNQASI